MVSFPYNSSAENHKGVNAFKQTEGHYRHSAFLVVNATSLNRDNTLLALKKFRVASRALERFLIRGADKQGKKKKKRSSHQIYSLFSTIFKRFGGSSKYPGFYFSTLGSQGPGSQYIFVSNRSISQSFGSGRGPRCSA